MNVQAVTPILNVSSLEESFFLCENCQGSRGITAPFPPTDTPWSVRECHIRHPDGHTIRVGAGLPEEPE